MLDSETIEIQIGDQRIDAWGTVEIVHDLYAPAGSWSITVPPRSVGAADGSLVRVLIGGRVEMVGIYGKCSETLDDSAHSLTLSGTSLAGQMQRFFLESWSGAPTSIKAADAKYCAGIPHLARFGAVFHDPSAMVSKAPELDVGTTTFDALSRYATALGWVFWIAPDGTRRYGPVVQDGDPSVRITPRNSARRRRDVDFEAMHSRIVLISDQGDDGHTKVSVANEMASSDAPAYVAAHNGSASDLRKQAAAYLRQERERALALEYAVAGFAFQGTPYAVNTLAQVQDPELDINDTFLVRRVAKKRTRDDGSTTTLTLAPRFRDPFRVVAGRPARMARRSLA